ncbi:hypothetical protein CEXT_796281, partial [Caerostris extrusa]
LRLVKRFLSTKTRSSSAGLSGLALRESLIMEWEFSVFIRRMGPAAKRPSGTHVTYESKKKLNRSFGVVFKEKSFS